MQHVKCRSTGKALLGNGRYLHLDLRMLAADKKLQKKKYIHIEWSIHSKQ